MATYELQGGEIYASISLGGGQIFASPSLGGGEIYPGGGGGGGNLQPSKSVSYTPTESAQSATVYPDYGYDGMEEVSVSVGAISSSYVGSGVTRQSGSTIAPTESVQTAVPSGTYTTGDVKIGAISSTYVGSGIPQRTSSDLSASGATVTAPSGYYASSASKTIPNASTPELSGVAIQNNGTVLVDLDILNGGYISSTADTLSAGTVTVKSAQTIYPSTSDQSIASGQYLTGAQTIKGVAVSANLIASNIVSGQTITIGDADDADRILSVTGTASGGGIIGVGDPYLLSIGNCGFFSDTLYCDMSNSTSAITRLSVWAKDGNVPVKYYFSGSNTPNASFHPITIPDGATSIGVTLGSSIQADIVFLEITNDVATSKISETGWTNFTANTEQTFSIPTGAKAIASAIRRNSSNSAFTQNSNAYAAFPLLVKFVFT